MLNSFQHCFKSTLHATKLTTMGLLSMGPLIPQTKTHIMMLKRTTRTTVILQIVMTQIYWILKNAFKLATDGLSFTSFASLFVLSSLLVHAA